MHLFGWLLFFFIAAYLPILYINFCWIIGTPEFAPSVVEVISLYLLIINSIINPVICIMMKKDYLITIKKLFMRYGYVDTQGVKFSLLERKNRNSNTPLFDMRARVRKKDSQLSIGIERSRIVETVSRRYTSL